MGKAFHNQTVPGQQEHDAVLQFMWMGLLVIAGAIAILKWVYALRPVQISEVVILLLLCFHLLLQAITRLLKRKEILEKQWPKPRVLVSEDLDRKYLELAAQQNSTLLGYENDGTPVYWTDEQRALQTALPGMSGAGKSTLLYNILEQDIRRGKTVIFLDGKGEKGFVLRLWAAAIAAGRAEDVRIIDPSNPSGSHRYNPFYSRDGVLGNRAGIVFESLSAANSKDEFFAEHQRSFLQSLCNVLAATGKTLTFQSILTAAQQPDTVSDIILAVRNKFRENPHLAQKSQFETDAMNLIGIYSESDWLVKIRGLLNSLMPFVGPSLLEITGATENLVTIEDVLAKKQILLVPMNLGGPDSQPLRAFGRILLRDLQSQIASRYDRYEMNQRHEFVSVVMDEFGLFAYPGFGNIIHTARQANACFIFSFQNMKQLAGQVGTTLAEDIATGTNCKFMMRISEDDTAQNFMAASSSRPTEKISYQIAKAGPLEGLGYEDVGRGTRHEEYETRVKDWELKELPKGQMIALLADSRLGIVKKHIHVRKPVEYFLHKGFEKCLPLLPEFSVSEEAQTALRISLEHTPEDKGGRRRRRS
jgi:hypothetical protein